PRRSGDGLAHDPEKCAAVFRTDHAQEKCRSAMMNHHRTLATLHRWWGVAFCLLFAMWFASGIVMHFMPFPARSASGEPARTIDTSHASTTTIDYDQWTVAGTYDRDRPLKRIALNDDAGTEIYVSAATGAVVLTTTRSQRWLNYAGSI